MWRRDPVDNYKGGVLLTEDDGKTWKPVSADIGEAAERGYRAICLENSEGCKKQYTVLDCY